MVEARSCRPRQEGSAGRNTGREVNGEVGKGVLSSIARCLTRWARMPGLPNARGTHQRETLPRTTEESGPGRPVQRAQSRAADVRCSTRRRRGDMERHLSPPTSRVPEGEGCDGGGDGGTRYGGAESASLGDSWLALSTQLGRGHPHGRTVTTADTVGHGGPPRRARARWQWGGATESPVHGGSYVSREGGGRLLHAAQQQGGGAAVTEIIATPAVYFHWAIFSQVRVV